jgi:hypothetical protein
LLLYVSHPELVSALNGDDEDDDDDKEETDDDEMTLHWQVDSSLTRESTFYF